MSNIAVQGGAGGTGTVTLLAPSTSTDRVLTLPDSTGTVATAESTLSQFNAGGSAPVYACRAWVNFNGTGTVAIRASGNVSSITDNGTGDYTVNFSTALIDENYSAVFGGQGSTGATNGYATGRGNQATLQQTTTTLRVFGVNGANAATDPLMVSVAIFR